MMHRPTGWLLGAELTPLLILLGSCIAAAAPNGEQDGAAPAGAAMAQAGTPPSAPARVPAQAITITLDRTDISQGSAVRGQVTPAAATLTLDGAPIVVAADGAFIVAFDRDARDVAVLRASATGTAPVERQIAVTPGGWRLEHVNANFNGGAASTEEFRRRRAGETAQINAARATPVTSDGWRQTFIWPARGRISGRFGSQRVYRGQPGSFHSGVDVAAGAGVPFVAPADGVVTLAATSPFTLEGNLIIVDHGMGLSSAFLHGSRVDVAVGDIVRQGQRLGLIGATGRASGPHLHWGMRWRGARLDAAKLAGPMP